MKLYDLSVVNLNVKLLMIHQRAHPGLEPETSRTPSYHKTIQLDQQATSM